MDYQKLKRAGERMAFSITEEEMKPWATGDSWWMWGLCHRGARCEHLAQGGWKKAVGGWERDSGGEPSGTQYCGAVPNTEALLLMLEEYVKGWFAPYNWWAIGGELRYENFFFKRPDTHFPLFQWLFSWFLFSLMLSSDLMSSIPLPAPSVSLWAPSRSGTSFPLAGVILFIAGHLTQFVSGTDDQFQDFVSCREVLLLLSCNLG